MNIISYCLFGTKKEFSKYGKFLPAVIIANRLAYPEFYQKFYISEELKESFYFNMLNDLSESFDEILVTTRKEDISGTGRMLWRLLPWWDKNCEYLLCRDIDSIVTAIEIRAVRLFMKSNFKMHSIRSHKYHDTPLMGGLSSFYCPWVRKQPWFTKNFKNFIVRSSKTLKERKPWVEGADQEALKRYLYFSCLQKKKNMLNTLDTPVQGANKFFGIYRPSQVNKNKYNKIDLSYMDKYKNIFKISSRVHSFVASPFKTISREDVNSILSIDHPIAKKVKMLVNANKG
ncbi:MAG: hypothetical protein ACOC56_01380 [Atribacterota bacterium]